MAVLHKIKAYLYENYLSKEVPAGFIARVSSERTLNVKQICEAAVSRGGADISESSMEHAVDLFFKEMGYQLCDGYSVNTGFFNASVSIKGTFDSPTENFNKQKHSVLFRFAQGEKLRAEIANIEVKVLGLAETSSAILQVEDIRTGSVNDVITPNRNFKINGQKIKIVGDDPTVGIFFIETTTGMKTAVPPEDIVNNNPSELLILTPDLDPGVYNVQIVSQYSGSTLLKDARATTYDKELTVS